MKRDYQSHSLFIKAADNLHSRFSFHHHSSQMFTNAYFYLKKKTLIEYFNFIISILCKHLIFICFWLSHSRSMRHRRLRLAVYLFDYFLNLFIRITAIEDIYIVIELSWVKLSEEFKCVYIYAKWKLMGGKKTSHFSNICVWFMNQNSPQKIPYIKGKKWNRKC